VWSGRKSGSWGLEGRGQQPDPPRRRPPLNNLADSDPGTLLVGVPVSERGAAFGLAPGIGKLHT